jgi:DUF4097 and DUF4098 domain-containing protein YvlB
VVLEGVQGKIEVDDQNGAVDIKSAAAGGCQDVSAKTSFAPIRVAIPDGAGYTVTARTSFGKVRSEIPITTTGGLSEEGITGKIGDGKCRLSLTNNNGNIDLMKAK